MDGSSREHWKSSLGFILAAAGSAIGLGNVWRFPTMTGANGGGGFVLLYLLVVLAVGLPLMYVELSLGRAAQQGPVGAFKKISPHSAWRFLGYLCILTGTVILSYYGVVAGWTLKYFLVSLMDGFPRGESARLFGEFTRDGASQILYMGLFMALTVGVVFFGVKGGIERISLVLMPALVLLLVALIAYALTLPTAFDGLCYYLIPDFSRVGGKTFLFAIGQAFFSLSLGMGAMLTYGSYLEKDTRLPRAGLVVVLADTLIAVMAGLVVFPVIGGAPDKAGPGLVFVAMADLFATLPGGRIVGALFFLLLAIAALTSTISLLEVAASHWIEQHGWTRRKAVLSTGAGILFLGIPSALSLGAVPGLGHVVTLAGKPMGFLDLMDFLFGNLALTVGGLLIILFTTFVWKRSAFEAELYAGSPVPSAMRNTVHFLLRVVAPSSLMAILAYMLLTGKTLG